MSSIDDVLTANARFAQTFEEGDLPKPPARGLAVVACMDARIDPWRALGLRVGDVHVIRNAGGRVTDDVIRSLVISSHLLGTTDYMVIHHTDCGLLAVSNDQLRERVSTQTGEDASGVDFLPFSDLDESVREDVAKVRASPLIPDSITVRGFIYDVHTGRLREVLP